MTTTKMTINVSDRECRRCDQTSIDTRNTHPFAVPCQGSAYRVSLASDTEVPTPEGWTTLGDITPGKEVFDEQGRICTVAEVSGESVEPVSEVKFGDGSSIVAGNHHPWMILSPTDFFPANLSIYRPGPWNAGCWPMTTLELAFSVNGLTERRTRHLHYIPIAGALDLPEWEAPIDPWILGLWLGDGDSDSATIYCVPDDEIHYRANVGETGELWHVLNPWMPVLRCSLARGPEPLLLTRLRGLDLVNNKHTPLRYLRANQEQRLALLQGLIDSDGHVYAKGTVEFTSKSIRLAEGVRELALSLGMKATVRESRERGVERRVSKHYRVRFTPTMPAATLPRKADVATELIMRRPKDASLRIARRRISEVQEAGIRTTRCISVDSQWGMMLVGRQMVPALVRRANYL